MKTLLRIFILLFFISSCKSQLKKTIESYPDGKIKIEYLYQDKSDTTHYIYYAYYESGKLEFQSKVANDSFIEGKTSYYENGDTEETEKLDHPVSFDDHKYDCTIRNYSENGIIENQLSYKNSLINGRAIYYDSRGKTNRTDDYIDGKLNGYEILYYPDGKIQNSSRCRNDSSIGFEYDFDEKGDTIRAFVHYGLSVDGIFYKKWLSNDSSITESYGNKSLSFVIWKWLDKNNKVVKSLKDTGKAEENNRREFIAPE